MPLFGLRRTEKKATDVRTPMPAVKNMPVKSGKTLKSSQPSKNSAVAVVKKNAPALPSGTFGSAADAILRPRITEKSGVLSQRGVYTFEVSRNANRQAISKAVVALYKVTPVKIALINLPAKKTFVRGRVGRVAGVRKALVTVKKGETINFV